MPDGVGMIWPLAAAYARKGWAVRRAHWTQKNNTTLGVFAHADTNLRWVVYRENLFIMVYQEMEDDVVIADVDRVITNEDFVSADFLADDWTVLHPDCLPAGFVSQPAADQQGFERYVPPGEPLPGTLDTDYLDIGVDHGTPNSGFGECALPNQLVPPSSGPVFPETPPIPSPGPETPPGDPDDALSDLNGVPKGGEDEESDDGDEGGGGGGGSGGSANDGRQSKQGRPKNVQSAEVEITNVQLHPQCFDNSDPTRRQQVTFDIKLKSSPDKRANGLYWITATVNGQEAAKYSERPPHTKNAIGYVDNVTPGQTPITVIVTASLPTTNATDRDSAQKVASPWCSVSSTGGA